MHHHHQHHEENFIYNKHKNITEVTRAEHNLSEVLDNLYMRTQNIT